MKKSRQKARLTHHSKSHEVFDALFEDHPVKQLADDLKLHENTLSTWRKPANHEDSQQRYNPLDRILQLVAATEDLRLIHWLCGKVGGYLTFNPGLKVLPPSLHQVSARVTQKFASMIECIAIAVADESVSMDEAAQIREVWEQLKTKVESFVVSCEKRDFESLNAAIHSAVNP
jgi:hypothetical protein